jgi:hypothetical protein
MAPALSSAGCSCTFVNLLNKGTWEAAAQGRVLVLGHMHAEFVGLLGSN